MEINKEKEKKIIEYLIKTYDPESIITYGSFGDGSANENSDFDALVIADHTEMHDGSVVDGTVLDVFVYPSDTFLSEYDPQEFEQIFDGNIVLDKYGKAGQLKNKVLDYIQNLPRKTEEEIRDELSWCEKMLARTVRGDEEGYYRWHWVLVDSLEIYYDIKGLHYHGPKKALRYMERNDQTAFSVYSHALKELNREYLSEWIECLKNK